MSGFFQGPAAPNLLCGYQTIAATTGATTVITVPAGRTWQGDLTVSTSCQNAGAATVTGLALGVISTTGAGALPAAGTYFAVQALAGANVVAGTVGSQGANSASTPFLVIAAAGTAATIAITVTITGTAGRVDVSAIGALF